MPAGARGERKPLVGGAAPARGFAFDLRRLVSGDVAVPIAVMGILVAMIMPLPPLLLDILISANITLSLVVLLVSMYIRQPAEFSVFPTTLLLMTLFRLALNVSSARLILLQGNRGTAAAGHVIESFGSFVVGGNYIIGVVIFLVLIAIQYVVINHGAVRISEVTARFTLDALPGKQMSIDADLNAGLISENEARDRRKSLALEAEFYGAMDGSTRFTQRDAVASILITSINIIAGFLIGVLQHGMELRQALETYTVLTIGDGLVTVIPALMISISGGLIVTRANSDYQMGTDFQRQVLGNPQPLMLASGALILMSLFPGLPTVPFMVLGSGVGLAAFRLQKRLSAGASAADAPAAPVKESLEPLLRVEPLAVEVGLGLVRMVEGGADSPLLRRIAAIRRQLAQDLGYLLPPVRVVDNLSLKVREYVVQLKGVEIARYELQAGCELAIPTDPNCPQIDGVPTKEPAFGISAIWIPAEKADQARSAGYTVVDSTSILGTHLSELIRRHSYEIFSRQDAKQYLDRVASEHPRVVEDLVPKLLPLVTVQRVVQNLLRERVSIRDGASVLESLSEAAAITRNPVLLTEFVRQSLRRTLVRPYLNRNGELGTYFLHPEIEKWIESATEHGEATSQLNMSPQKVRDILEVIARSIGPASATALILASTGSRHFLRQLIEAQYPNVAVISHAEVPAGIRVISLGVISQ